MYTIPGIPTTLPLKDSCEPLVDNYGRHINYLRLAVTDRCNLRCTYCMPSEGIDFLPQDSHISFEEMERLVKLITEMGVSKVRITGGEPFARKGLITFLQNITKLPKLKFIHITTNGVLTAPFIPVLKEMEISGLNVSLDTLQRVRFRQITGRDHLDAVLQTIKKIIEYEVPLKINTVVMDEFNCDEIIPIAQLAKDHSVQVRFIEQMPFNGGKDHGLLWPVHRIKDVIKAVYPTIEPTGDLIGNVERYRIPGFKGEIGFIGSNSRTFCSTCNRIRITPKGLLKTCLYSEHGLELKTLLKAGKENLEIKNAINQYCQNRFKNGHIAEQSSTFSHKKSMAQIGG
jgi:molybdenum cofactor biosynthesis protein A